LLLSSFQAVGQPLEPSGHALDESLQFLLPCSMLFHGREVGCVAMCGGRWRSVAAQSLEALLRCQVLSVALMDSDGNRLLLSIEHRQQMED
jgi:hypothetical protein